MISFHFRELLSRKASDISVLLVQERISSTCSFPPTVRHLIKWFFSWQFCHLLNATLFLPCTSQFWLLTFFKFVPTTFSDFHLLHSCLLIFSRSEFLCTSIVYYCYKKIKLNKPNKNIMIFSESPLKVYISNMRSPLSLSICRRQGIFWCRNTILFFPLGLSKIYEHDRLWD